MMHNTMYAGDGMGLAFPLFMAVHGLASLAFIIGLILLLCWACKHLPEKQLKTWGLWLAIGGLVLSLLSAGSGFTMMGRSNFKMKFSSEKGMGGMMEKMMDEDDAMGMSMHDMSAILEGKTGDAFDAAFLEGMIPHHQGAIDMANAALTNAKHDEIKNMAKAIISAQQKEIDQMEGWQQSWGYDTK